MTKKYLLFFMLILFSVMRAQNYRMMKNGDRKFFSENTSFKRGMSLTIDSVKTVGADSIYYNYLHVDQWSNNSSPNCIGWFGGCNPYSIYPWTGTEIRNTNGNDWHFINSNNDALKFKLTSLMMSDTSVFYSDASQKFSIIFENSDTLSVLGVLDSVHYYKIHHTDLSANTINSTLHGEKIIIGKDIGLIKFFQIDSFPVLEKSLFISGYKNNNTGIHTLTEEDFFNFAVGDSFVYHETSSDNTFANPYTNYNRYTEKIVTNKVLTPNDVTYTFDVTTYTPSTGQFNYYTSQELYGRNISALNLPFERYDTIPFPSYPQIFGSTSKLHTDFYLGQYCNYDAWTLKTLGDPTSAYCAESNCYMGIDTNGPPMIADATYVCGLGFTRVYANSYGGTFLSTTSDLLYFNKGGVSCGTQITLGKDFIELNPVQINLSPNPANNNFTVTLTNQNLIKELQLSDLSGKTLMVQKPQSATVNIDASQLPEGVYLVNIITKDAAHFVKKLIVIH